MRMKKTLRTAGVTLLGTIILLLISALLFLGVWALLPDHTGETHSHDTPSAAPEHAQAELYPWNRMTVPWEDGADTLDEDTLLELLDPLLAPQLYPPALHVVPYGVNWNEGEFLCDETQGLFGVRNAEILVRTYSTVIVDQNGIVEMAPDAESLLSCRFSFAFREQDDAMEICFVSLEPPSQEGALPADEEAGLTALTEWMKMRDLNLDSGSPFATFLWRFTDLCALLNADYESYNAALLLYGTGSCEITQENHTVYYTFKGREGEMTLLCDPVSQTVYGISIRQDSYID